MCVLGLLDDDVDEAPSWKISPNAHAAPLRGGSFPGAVWSRLAWWRVPWWGAWHSGESWGHEEPECQVLAAAAAATQGDTTKHSFLVWECQNTLRWQCQKNVFYTDNYQKFLFLEKLWLFKLFVPDEIKWAMTTVSQGQKVWSPAACRAAAWVVSTSKGTGKCFCSHVFLSLMLHHSL